MSYQTKYVYEEGSPNPPRKSGVAIVALILGILSLCLPLLSIPALICGFIGIGRVNREPGEYGGRGMAITGVITGFISLAFGIIMIVIFVMAYMAAKPRIAQAEALANRSRDMANVRGIAQSAHIYASGHNGAFPPHLAALLLDGQVTPKALISNGSTTTPLELPPGINDWKLIVPDVDGHCDFTYIGGDLSAGDPNNAFIVVLYSKDSHLGGRVLGFGDGHSEFLTDAMVPQYFDQANRLRGEIGLPQVFLDGPPPPARSIAAIAGRGGVGGRNPIPPRPNLNIPPPPAPHKLAFSNLQDALNTLSSGLLDERRAALSYIEQAPVVDAQRVSVTTELEKHFNDNTVRPQVVAIYRKWATKNNRDAIRTLLQDLSQRDPTGHSMEAIQERTACIQMLAQFNDLESAKVIALCLRNASLQAEATKALAAMGPKIEEDMLQLLATSDPSTSQELFKLLATIGTSKSIIPLQRAMDTSPSLAIPATKALQELGSRLKLKPDEYLYAALNHFVIEVPAGFTEESLGKPNIRQWSRTAPGRAIRSVYTVQVKFVGKDHVLNAPPNAVTLQAEKLTLTRTDFADDRLSSSAKFAVVDGDYLLEVTAIMDKLDRTAETSLNTAAKKIRVRTAPN